MLYDLYLIAQTLCLFYDLIHNEYHYSAALYRASP
jgi:hypothetical protein